MHNYGSVWRLHWFRYLVVLLVLLLILAVWAIMNYNQPSRNVNTPATTNVDSSGKTTSPDPVKTDSGANSDTTPSPSGTGDGSSNSLLGQ